MIAFLKTFVAVVTALITFFSAGGMNQLKAKGDISGYAQTVTEFKEMPDLYVGENGDLTVLQISDTHFTTGLSWLDISVLQKMEKLTVRYAPDLVVMTGDLIDDGNSGAFNKQYVLDTVGQMFEKLEQFWAYIPGNNDGINYGTSEDIVAYLSQYEHCLVADVKDISGGAQYSIDIRDADKKLIHSFIFLDTMDYDREDEDHIYGYVHDDQVKWCEDEIAKKQAENKDVRISAFIHENTPNFARAAVDGKKYKTGYPTIVKQAEKYNIPKNQPLDDVFDNSGCVGLVSIGHVHPTTCKCSFYNGTYYHITPKAMIMSTLITIHTAETDTRRMYDFKALV